MPTSNSPSNSGASLHAARGGHQDFAEYEEFMPLEDIPVLTKTGVGCSLAEFQRHLCQKGSRQSPSSKQGKKTAGAAMDIPPPPYVEELQEDTAARKTPMETMDHEVQQPKAGRSGTGECLFVSRQGSLLIDIAIGSSTLAEHNNSAANASLLRPVLAQLIASRSRSFTSLRTSTPSSRSSTPVPRVH